MHEISLKDSIFYFFKNLLDNEGEFLLFNFSLNPEKDTKTNQAENTQITKNDRSEKAVLTIISDEIPGKELWENSNNLENFYELIHNCKKCKFGETRNHFVFGAGNPNAEIMLIGEAPGADEDLQGVPFVGKAGQLLTKILGAINLQREEVYIANVVKCRPPGNKTPTEDDFKDCLPYLLKQIELIKPKFILTLGAVPLKALLGAKYQITKVRGKILDFKGIVLIPTFHPAYLLRNPNAKKEVWEDVQLLQRLYLETKK
jgi:DNA polymerase